jgi:hypothetical protein
MKIKKVKYDAIKLAILRKEYLINQAINDLLRDLPHYDFECLRMHLTNELAELHMLKKQGAK